MGGNDVRYIDGIDFTTECADYLTVGPLTLDDAPLPPAGSTSA